MKSLVVGLGIGELYCRVLEKLGADVYTVDQNPDKLADFTSLDAALDWLGPLDTVNICTPNFTHYDLALKCRDRAKIVFVEKPGVKDSIEWLSLTKSKYTRYFLVKNNQYRDNINWIKSQVAKSNHVLLSWVNKDRIPHPGSWFTNKKLAFGGVSRDLFPHMLSFYLEFEPTAVWHDEMHLDYAQRWKLSDIASTSYGSVNVDGIYDVDDFVSCRINGKYSIVCDWRSNDDNEFIGIELTSFDGNKTRIPLGLCPEDAYQHMIDTAFNNYNDISYWATQNIQDLWIHKTLEKIR
jgi:hypothetical protein